MDFGVLDGSMSSENKNTLTSSCDLDGKTKWYGSEVGVCKQEISSVSAAHEAEWRNLKMAKINEDDISKTMILQHQQQQYRSNGGQSMLSFSSPNTQSSVTFPYYARNNMVAAGYGVAGPFTPSQWMELEHQALIYKYITANAAIPSNLLIPIRKALETAAFSAYSDGWGAFHLGFCNSSDPEPGRCRRTDGKKWRCAKDAIPDQKYCERHMNRGRHRSRKPVEAQNCNAATIGAGKITTGSPIFRRNVPPNPATSSQDNRIIPVLHSSSVALKNNDHSTPEETSSITEFGLVCSDSLLNPMHKSDLKSQNSLHQFMEEWPHSSQVSTTSERLDLSPLRMGLGMISKQVKRVPGGPLGEVLQHSRNNSPTCLNTMTEPTGPISHKMQLGYLQ